MNTTVNLENTIHRILCLLKVSVDVASEGKIVRRIFRAYFLCYFFQDLIALVWIFISIHF